MELGEGEKIQGSPGELLKSKKSTKILADGEIPGIKVSEMKNHGAIPAIKPWN